jgi:hypothetical protein
MWPFDMDKTVRQLMSFMVLEGIETYYPTEDTDGLSSFTMNQLIFEIAQIYHLFKTGGTGFSLRKSGARFFCGSGIQTYPRKHSATV